MEKECLYYSCNHTFTSILKGYENCPECGSATIAIDIKNDIDKEKLKATSKYHKEMIDLSRYGHFFKCPFGRECMLLGHYEPCCEQKLFRHECLIPVHRNQDVLDRKLDKILDHLGLNNQ